MDGGACGMLRAGGDWKPLRDGVGWRDGADRDGGTTPVLPLPKRDGADRDGGTTPVFPLPKRDGADRDGGTTPVLPLPKRDGGG